MAEIVLGEAQESDDELQNKMEICGAVVHGEGSESDEDVFRNGNNYSNVARPPYTSNLLQRKLVENNLNICKSINAFTKSLMIPVSKQMMQIDQVLIKSQVSMQTVLSALYMAQRNSLVLQQKTEDIFTASFIPSIVIELKHN